MTRSQIQKWLNNEYDCFLVYGHNNIPIAGMWFFKDTFELVNTSGRTLSNGNEIVLDSDTVYGAYAIVDENYRGTGVNQCLLNFIIKYYSENSAYKKILLITGANNVAYIRGIMKFKGILIGITEVYNILGFKIRKGLFLDIKEKVWNN